MNMNNRPKPVNPWNQNVQQPKQLKPKSNLNKNSNSEIKFKEQQQKLQTAVQKFAYEYESSSEEDEIETEDLITRVLENYTNTGGEHEKLIRTTAYLKDAFLSGAATCLICISRIKRDDEIWSCQECYCFFHLMCINKWSKDNISQKKNALEGQIVMREMVLCWGCPKCRHNYEPNNIPSKYECFCKKTINPKYQSLLVPHSCGDICHKNLKPECGHQCLLLCHPGSCPPCPVTVNCTCFCGSKLPRLQRCSDKNWSCGETCKKLLSCDKHNCPDMCHPGDCKPCEKKSIQKCICKSQMKLRDCASPIWQCDKVCNKLLDCGKHNCLEVCHIGVCDVCIFSKPRTCPCGKTNSVLPCTEDTPTCPDTCDKILECGLHTCSLKCHKDKCAVCLEIVEKRCRCNLHLKEVQCSKPYLCETKCKNLRDCYRHPCNRKCCNGECPPCEKQCGRTLKCGNHKCPSVCHRGPCYPCNLTETVSCRCGGTMITVPCGRKNKVKPPKCLKLCRAPTDCHHKERTSHRCHFGECPPCRQICEQRREKCTHPCSSPCHYYVYVDVEIARKPSMPWEQIKPQKEKRRMPCPDCKVPVAVTCLGGHETTSWPCYETTSSRVACCQRSCGRVLACGNHTCSMTCHSVDYADSGSTVGSNCEVCDSDCTRARPEGCVHVCPKPCHPGSCPPCKQMLRIKCHCGVTNPYVSCAEWLIVNKQEELQSCGNQCPKNYACGHRCRANCHSGTCPNEDSCNKKVKVSCKCKRIKKEFGCQAVRVNGAKVECDDVCKQLKLKRMTLIEEENEQKRALDAIRNKEELEKFKRKFEGKKKSRVKFEEDHKDESKLERYVLVGAIIVVVSLAFGFLRSFY